MKITAILPVSRTQYLDRVLSSLLDQTIVPHNLIVVFDGNDHEYLSVRNRIVQLEGINTVCVVSNNDSIAHSISERRMHIVNVHNQIREIVADCDWVFSIEDDGILPPDALEKLIKNTTKYDNVGIVSGVELGRWGIKYVGAWRVDNVFEPKNVKSLENKAAEGGVEELDGCGLYCSLIRADYYKSHEFLTNNGLGPDVNLGLYLRQEGFKNYIDWSIHVTHLTSKNGVEEEILAIGESQVISLLLLSGSTWKY